MLGNTALLTLPHFGASGSSVRAVGVLSACRDNCIGVNVAILRLPKGEEAQEGNLPPLQQ